MKIASLVTGILSLIFCFIPFLGLLLGIIAICTARSSAGMDKIEGMAAAGLACGIIGLCIGIIVFGATGCTLWATLG